MNDDILSLFPKTQAFLSQEEADNINDHHSLFAVLERLLTRIEILEGRKE